MFFASQYKKNEIGNGFEMLQGITPPYLYGNEIIVKI